MISDQAGYEKSSTIFKKSLFTGLKYLPPPLKNLGSAPGCGNQPADCAIPYIFIAGRANKRKKISAGKMSISICMYFLYREGRGQKKKNVT